MNAPVASGLFDGSPADGPDVKSQDAPLNPSTGSSWLFPRPRPESDDFRWNSENEDIAVPGQRAIEVYVNPWDQIVICAERTWDEERGHVHPHFRGKPSDSH
jgi:hypothetical protein